MAESTPNNMMRSNNVSIINVCNRGRDGHLETMHRIARQMHQRQPDPFPFASCFDLTRIEEPGYGNEVIAWLDGTFKDGAVMTKLWKEVGIEVRRKDGSFVLSDDPVFDPIYEFLAARSKPLMAHLADPIDGWLPLDRDSPHYGYFAINPGFHLYGKPGYPSHADFDCGARSHFGKAPAAHRHRGTPGKPGAIATIMKAPLTVAPASRTRRLATR